METKEHTCIICNKKERTPLYAGGDLCYMMCLHCGFVELSPHPTKEDYEHFYRNEYQKHRHDIVSYEQAIAIRKEKGLEGKRQYLNDLEPFLSKRSRVFEIGCGWGTFLKLARDTYGVYVEGIEPAELTSRVAREYYGLPVKAATLDEYRATYEGAAFDIVMMMHVLEHFVDPMQALEQALMLLKEDGVLYIAVPNVAKPNEPLDRYFHFEHVTYFSPATLTKLLEACGCKVLWNENTHEIRMVAARASHPYTAFPVETFEATYSAQNIQQAIARQDRKYAFLRVLKRVARAVLPNRLFKSVRKGVVTLLKHLNIIKI